MVRKKSFFISIALFFLFEIVFAEEACELIEDGQLCEREDGMIFISPMIMEQIYNESLVGPFAPFQPNASFFTLNGLVEPFAEDLQIDVVNKNYTIFSLTNFRDTQNRIHDLVTSIKSQGFGDCAKFAAAGVIEIESMRIYNNIFQEAKNVVSFNGGDTNNVEIDLSEAFLQEINGCTSSSVKIGESLVSRGVVQEEHYPYVHRGFGKPKYYSKRDVNRFKDFKDIGSVYGCTTGIDEDNSWNYELFNKSVDVGWLVFRPNDILFLQRNINTVKEYIRNGKPLVMSFQSHCLNKERILEVTGAWGKFNNMKINSTSASKTGGHAVVVVGYITPTDGNGQEYLLIKNSYGYKELEAIPIDNLFDFCSASFFTYGDIQILRNGVILSEQQILEMDRDSDGVPDIFDNYSFTDLYNNYSSVSAVNSMQNEIDEDVSTLESDACPYFNDEKSLNTNMGPYGDFCNYDIDGDGVPNWMEGLPYDFLSELLESTGGLSTESYYALNPFIDSSGVWPAIRNSFFITACFMNKNAGCGFQDNCENEQIGKNYISDLCFFHPHLEDTNSGKDGTFKFYVSGEKAHNFFINKESINAFDWLRNPEKMVRKYDYMDKGIKKSAYGLKWNVPGQFEMKNTVSSEFIASNYGESQPESFYNCVLYCEMINEIYKKAGKLGIIDLNSCESACKNVYNIGCDHNTDRDCDGYRNEQDNCPDEYNFDQLNIDGDKYGNACDICKEIKNESLLDSDEDSIPDDCDSCPTVSNLTQIDSDEDGIGDACDRCDSPNSLVWDTNPYQELFAAKDLNGSKGAALLNYGYFTADRKYFVWQPDHDLDGIPDECDYHYFGNAQIWDFAYNKIKDVRGNSSLPIKNGVYFPIFPAIINKSAKVSIQMPAYSGQNPFVCPDNTCDIAIHYCAITHEEKSRNLWGQDGYCTITEKTENPLYKETSSNKFTCDFGFSHGSDDYTIASILRWQKRVTNKNIKIDSKTEYLDAQARLPIKKKTDFWTTNHEWNWRRDWYVENHCLELPTLPVCQSLKNSSVYNEANTMYYALSTNVVVSSNEYIIKDSFNLENINPAYFINAQKYSRANRYGIGGENTGMLKLNYYQRQLPVVPPTIDLSKFEIEYCPFCYVNVPPETVVGNDGNPIPEAYENTGRWSFSKVQDEYSFGSQQLYYPQNLKMIAGVENLNMYAVTARSADPNSQYASTEYELRFNSVESGADWNKIGVISNWNANIHDVETAVEKDGRIYFISKKGPAENFSYLFAITPPALQPLGTFICNDDIPAYTLIEIGEVDADQLDKIRLVSINDSIYLTGSDANSNVIRIMKLDENNEFVEVQGVMPPARSILNLGVTNKYLYLTGGLGYNNQSMTDMWRFNAESDVWEQIPVTLNGDFRKAVSQIVDGKMVIANPLVGTNETHPAIEINPAEDNIENVLVTYVDIPVTEFEFSEFGDYCINETDDLIRGGFDISGTCIPFTHPWYRQFSAGATVYSVAGKGDRLYVGTSSSIKVYDISDPASMTLKYTFSTNSRIVYDLEVADGDIMYAATSKGIYKLSIANPDTLTSLTFYSTGSYNYQYKIQLYNDKLYVGDDNGINIRDKNTFARLAYVNTGSILDFAIADGEIAMYWSAFWDEGIQIRDADTLNMKAYDYATCYTGELTADHGEFYLSCDDYEYRFVGLPNTYLDYFPVDGDIREMQENYAYNGWAYISDGSYVKQSTSNDVPAVCGNGVTEPGELCDGNSVECTTLDPEYTGGTAACNSTCDGYNENNCEVDGW